MRYVAVTLILLALLAAACDDDSSSGDNNLNNINNTNNTNTTNNINNINNTNTSNNQTNACHIPFETQSDYDNYLSLLPCLRSSDDGKLTAIEGFIESTRAHGGFPIQSGDTTVFVYFADSRYDTEDDAFSDEDFAQDRRLPPLRVAGDFNAWESTLASYEMTDEGLGFFHLSTTVDLSVSRRQTYKYVSTDSQGGDVWFSDPLSRRFYYDPFGRYSVLLGGDPSEEGHLELLRDVEAVELANSRDVYIYLPPGYETTTDSYPVLYMHDGNNLFDTAQPYSNGTWDLDGVAEMELSAGNIRPFIAVGIPNNADRMEEYTHVEDALDFGQGVQVMGGRGDLYAAFIVDDLMPLVNARYRTLTERENTAVMGSSLGGLISYYIAYLYPELFRLVGGLSSTFGWGAFSLGNPTMAELYAAETLLPLDQVYYLDSGDNPGNPVNPPACPTPDTESEDNYCETAAFRDMLVGAGIDTFPDDPDAIPLTPGTINIYHWHEPDAPHNEAAWNARLFRPLRLFFPAQ